MIFKLIAGGVCVGAFVLIMIFGCESTNGPEPSYICSYKYDSLVMILRSEQGQVPLGRAIPLDSLKQIMVTDSTVKAVVTMPDYKDIYKNKQFYTKIGKIVFK